MKSNVQKGKSYKKKKNTRAHTYVVQHIYIDERKKTKHQIKHYNSPMEHTIFRS